MEGRVVVRKLGARPEVLIIKVVAGQAMKLIAARLGSHGHLDGTGAPVFDSKGVDLHARLLNGIRIGNQVDHAGPDIARDIQAVDDEHVAVAAPAIRAGIYLQLSRKVIAAGTRGATRRGTPARNSRR